MVYLDFWLLFTQWHIENLVQSFFFFFFFQNLGGSVIYKDAPCARGTSIHVISPYFGRSSLYFAHFFEKISLPKFGNFLLCLIILPIWKKKISLFVISNVSHVWTQAFFFFCFFFFFSTEFRKSLWKLFDKQGIIQILKRHNNEKRQEQIMIMI